MFLIYIPSIGVNFKYKMLDHDSNKVKIQIWDTAGADNSNPLLKIYYKKASAIILMFSLEDIQSFDGIHTWMQHLQANADPGTFVFLVGNKCESDNRIVEMSEIKELQNKYNIEKYIETSVKDGVNVNETFIEILREIEERKNNSKSDIKEVAQPGNY